MPEKNFYNYCAQSGEGVAKALSVFLVDREKIKWANPENSILEEVFEYCQKLLDFANDPDPKTSARAKNFLRFLEVDILAELTAKVQGPPLWLKFYQEILSLNFILGKTVLLEVYDEKDLMLIGLGQWDDYNGSILTGTLGQVLNRVLPSEIYVPALKSFLPKDQDIYKSEMPWGVAFNLAVVYYILWENFSVLRDDFKDFLLENFFYISVVAGAPVLEGLHEFLNSFNADDKNKTEQKILAVLNKNKELVPVTVSGKEMILLPEIVKRYYASLNQEGAGGFTHEEFLQKYYEAEKGRDTYRGWLRTAMGPYLYLK